MSSFWQSWIFSIYIFLSENISLEKIVLEEEREMRDHFINKWELSFYKLPKKRNEKLFLSRNTKMRARDYDEVTIFFLHFQLYFWIILVQRNWQCLTRYLLSLYNSQNMRVKKKNSSRLFLIWNNYHLDVHAIFNT